jgi:heme exporter protein D
LLSEVVPNTSPVQALVRRAHRRHTTLAALDELGFVLAVALASFGLLIALGTDVFAGYWIALLTLAGLIVATVRVRRRILSRYRVAQILDARLKLDDSISTSWFLLELGSGKRTSAAEYQIQFAERVARGIDPARVLAFRGQRAWAAAGMAAAVALLLFTSRYAVTGTLDLRAPIFPISFPPIAAELESAFHSSSPSRQSAEKVATSKNQGNSNEAGKSRDRGTASESAALPQEAAKENASGAVAPDPRASNAGSSRAETGKRDTSGDSASAEQRVSNASAERRASASDAQRGEDAPDGESRPGLVDRMESALSSLLAGMKTNAPSAQPKQDRQTQPSSQDSKSAEQTASAQTQNGQQQPTDDSPATAHETAASVQATAADKNAIPGSRGRSNSGPDKGANSQSGIGHQNGDKTLQEAEDLKAMGKLAEIIGKRSAETTGEATVEVSSGNQQLKTQYSGRVGEHLDRGGEINRDEVPIQYRDYVLEYMRRVRNQADKETPTHE